MDYDVVVVGAGPSGSTAARTLAEKDLNVLLIDKGKFPRDKPCGGGLPLRTINQFPYLKDLESIQSYSYGGYISSSSSPYKTEIMKSEPVLAMVQRSSFDAELVKLAEEKGAIFQDESSVHDIKIHQEYAQLFLKDGSSIKTEIVIGADGHHSTIAKKTNPNHIRNNKGICVVEEFQLHKNIIEKYYTSKYLCYIHSKFNGIKGYGWVFPKQNCVNVGIISYDDTQALTQKKENIKQIYSNYLRYLQQEHILPDQPKSCNMKGGIVPVGPLSKTYFNRVILCGDAAGLINPISGEGIYYAIVSGTLAGNISSEALCKKDTSEHFLYLYEKQWKQQFGKEINLFLKSKKQWGKQGDNIIKIMNQDPKFAEMIFLIMVGKKSVYDLRWKIIKRFLRNKLAFATDKS